MLNRARRQAGTPKDTKKVLDALGKTPSRRETKVYDNLRKKMAADEKLIGRVQEIRARNNRAWMDLLRLAMRHAPAAAKALLREITANDKQVSTLTTKLAGGGRKK